MLKVLRNWVHRYFSDEQAVVLAVILLLGFTAILTLGGMLAPVLAGLVLAFLMQGLVNLAERLRLAYPGGMAGVYPVHRLTGCLPAGTAAVDVATAVQSWSTSCHVCWASGRLCC